VSLAEPGKPATFVADLFQPRQPLRAFSAFKAGLETRQMPCSLPCAAAPLRFEARLVLKGAGQDSVETQIYSE